MDHFCETETGFSYYSQTFKEQITLTFTPVKGLYRNQQTMLYASSFLQDLSPFSPPKEKKKIVLML